MAVNAMKTEDVPMASIKLNPNSMQSAGIKNTPPPTPSKPDMIPIEKPTIAALNILNSINAFFPSVLEPKSISNATMNKRHANMICRISVGTMLAKRPPQNPPIIPKIANRMAGLTIDLFFF